MYSRTVRSTGGPNQAWSSLLSARPRRGDALTTSFMPKPSCEARRDQLVELAAAADRIGDRHLEARALLRHEHASGAVVELRRVHRDARAADRGIGAAGEREIQ